jgi:hypothetical protein
MATVRTSSVEASLVACGPEILWSYMYQIMHYIFRRRYLCSICEQHGDEGKPLFSLWFVGDN